MYVNPNLQANLGKSTVNAVMTHRERERKDSELTCVLFFSGQEHPSDNEGGELKLPEQLAGRRDSISSLESTVSSSITASHPEQYEVIKQQKDIIEHGIEL